MGVTVPGECFKPFSRVWGVDTGKTGFFFEGQVGRKEVIRNPPDLMARPNRGERCTLNELRLLKSPILSVQ